MTRAVVPLPVSGDVFPDARGTDRGLRVSWHTELGLVVVSLWREDTCVGTFQLPRDEVPRLIATLANGLVESPTASAQNPRQAS